MDAATKYQMQKRINELKAQNEKMRDDLYQFYQAADEIYSAVCDIVANNGTNPPTIKCSFILTRLKRAWRSR